MRNSKEAAHSRNQSMRAESSVLIRIRCRKLPIENLDSSFACIVDRLG
jgi:hypothetical protein